MLGGVDRMLLLLLAVEAEGFSGKALLVSMDGFRWDYIKNISGLGNFIRLAKTGVSVDYVKNVFPTKTFPTHYSIATGLYPESHGIVANAMYDPVRNATFRKWSTETFWWEGGEPIWITAEKQNRKTGTFFWVGSEVEVHGKRPSIYKKFNNSIPFPVRARTAISWFVNPAVDFATIYFPEPDATGHVYGPYAEELKEKVREMDGILGLILDTLDLKNLSDSVNVIVTSDHGMADVDMENRLLSVWDYVNRSLISKIPVSGTITFILPANEKEKEVLDRLKSMPHVTVYRKEDIPDRLHYKNNPRIMPIVILADEGWTVTDNVIKSKERNRKGDHGYDNELTSMKPIFFARGPDFRKGVKFTSIHQLDIYPLLCRLLNIEAAPNNGSVQRIAHLLVDTKPSSAGHSQRGRLFLQVLLVVVVVLLVVSKTE